ncbi:hypothetical protein RM407_002362 [Enterobacter kobei]|nr:hypothetical protein [Enterobacter kobei]
MLQRTLSEHAAECFYGDERLAAWLWQSLQPTSEGFIAGFWEKLQDRFYHLLVEGVEARYPREHRLTDVRQLMGKMCAGELLLTPELPWLHDLQQRLLLRNGDLLSYREREVKAYVRLAAGLDPTLLVGWHLAQWLEDIPQPAIHDIHRVLSAQTTFFAPSSNPSQPFAEGHVHWGGITTDCIILDGHLLSKNEKTLSQRDGFWQEEQHEILQPLQRRARQLLILLLDKEQGWPSILNTLSTRMDEPKELPNWEVLANRFVAAKIGSSEWLLGEFARTMQYGRANRWLWLYLYLCSLYRSPNTHPLQRAATLCFWQSVNLLRRTLIMDGQGLTRFVERYFKPALGRGGDIASRVQRVWMGQGDVAEIKSTPSVFAPKFAKRIAKELIAREGLQLPKPPYIFGEHEIPLDTKALASMHALEKWQFCGHFLRSATHQKNQHARPDIKGLWKQAEDLVCNLQSGSGWVASEFMGGNLNSNFRFQPARWFRGLDVAGDENALKIEWFAPVLRWLRSGFKSKQAGELACSGFHLSIHAGEDYAHPASGMRHVDETVQFCQMREGDRLGHALALGIDPKRWAKRQGEMILTLDEHLDNLVWLWHHASLLSACLPLAQQVLPLLTRRIARFWRESCWWQVPDPMSLHSLGSSPADFDSSPLRSATADDLFASWLLRRNCHYSWQGLRNDWPLQSKESIALPDHKQLVNGTSMASKLYFARHEWLSSGKEKQLVVIRVGDESLVQAHFGSKHNNDLLEDVETTAELDFMHALQDWLLNEYDQLGLIIEANPTSNVYIARLKSHAEHPIFRWHPPDESVLDNGAEANLYGLRRGPVRVLVNTDDPGIMPTTLRTEFLLLREAALELKVGRTVAERWLETLRQYSLEQFHRNHRQVFEPI